MFQLARMIDKQIRVFRLQFVRWTKAPGDGNSLHRCRFAGADIDGGIPYKIDCLRKNQKVAGDGQGHGRIRLSRYPRALPVDQGKDAAGEKTLDELNGEFVGFIGQDRHVRAAGSKFVKHFDYTWVRLAMEVPALLVEFEKKATTLTQQLLVTTNREAALHEHLITIADIVAKGVERMLRKTKMIKDGVGGAGDVTEGIEESAVEIKYY